MQQSEIAQVIVGDELAKCLSRTVETFHPRTILDIGASDGTGSTQVLLHAGQGEIYALELDNERYKALTVFASERPRVHPYRAASVGLDGLMPKEYIAQFKVQHPGFNLWRSVGLQYMLDWYDQTVDLLNEVEIKRGIQHIKTVNNIEYFDMVVIDGGPFTGAAELREVYGAKVIVMDDVQDLKCFDAHRALLTGNDYKLIEQNLSFRNGFAVFKLKDDANS